MTKVAKAIMVVGFAAVGMWGLHNEVEYAGWVLMFSILAAM